MQNKIIMWLSANRVLLEVLLVSLTTATYFLMKCQVIKGQEPFMILMTTLAIFYFISAYFPVESKGFMEMIAMKVVGISSAVCVMGLQFYALDLSGPDTMLLIGGISLAAAGLMLIVTWLRSQNFGIIPLLIRVVILAPIVVFAFTALDQQAK